MMMMMFSQQDKTLTEHQRKNYAKRLANQETLVQNFLDESNFELEEARNPVKNLPKSMLFEVKA